MNVAYEMYINIFSGYLIIAGTYILSRNIFDNNMRRFIPYELSQKRIPFSIKLLVFTFGYRKKLHDLNYWSPEIDPTYQGKFSYKVEIVYF